MSGSKLLNLLDEYAPASREESEQLHRFREFVSRNDQCFSRELLSGHVTGSAWIVNPELSHCLLIHHRKLNRWLQPGGHADGCTDIEKVARKEAIEETGLTGISLFSPSIFDIDIHLIPRRPGIPAHLHYDVRFIYRAEMDKPADHSPEINKASWFTLDNAQRLVPDNDSILRMIEKTRDFTLK